MKRPNEIAREEASMSTLVELTIHQDLTLMQGRLKTLSLTSLLQE